MRIATFNVLHGRAPEDGRVDLDRFGEAVASLGADVLALQEVDRLQDRSHRVDLTELAAEAAGAVAHRFVPALSGAPGAWTPARDDDPPGTPQYGIALVSRVPVVEWEVVRLPVLRGRVPVVFAGRRRPVLVRDEPRVAVVARLDGLAVVATHLSFIPWWNQVQLHQLARVVPRAEPVVLAGDLNMQPAQAVRTTGLAPLVTGWTYPADDPVEQIDHVLGRGVSGTGEVRRLPLSDHRALVADLE